MNLEKEAIEIIGSINADIDDIKEEPVYLNVSTAGFAFDVTLPEYQIFSSECDTRRFDEERNEYEPLEDCIRRNLRNRIIQYAKAFGVTADEIGRQ